MGRTWVRGGVSPSATFDNIELSNCLCAVNGDLNHRFNSEWDTASKKLAFQLVLFDVRILAHKGGRTLTATRNETWDFWEKTVDV
jgi:hypothetical protein